MARGGIRNLDGKQLVFRESQYASRNFGIAGNGIGSFAANAIVPRPKFLFFVRFRLSSTAIGRNLAGLSDTTAFNNIKEGVIFQIKQIDKPKFNINTETLHQYNKKRVVQTKIDYNPMTINFHDDVGDRVLKFWADYFEYYYGDGGRETTKDWRYDVTNRDFYNGAQTSDSVHKGWGYKGAFSGGPDNAHFLESIELIQFYGQAYTSIEFVRPMITIFDHDSSDYEEGREGTGIRMSFDYEGVLYHLEPQTVEGKEDQFGFVEDYYDPISSGDKQNPNIDVTTRQRVFNPSSDISRPTDRSEDGSFLKDIRSAVDGFLSSSATVGVIPGGRSFGGASGPNTNSLSNLVSASGLNPSADLIEKETGIKNTVNNFGTPVTPSTGNILQTSTRALNTGVDSLKVDVAASVLSAATGNGEEQVAPGQTRLAIAGEVNSFSRTLGATAALAKNQGLVSSVASYVDNIDHDSSKAKTVVNKLPSGKFQVTELGATIFNSTRAPTSAVGVKSVSSPWENPDTVNNNKRLLEAESGDGIDL